MLGLTTEDVSRPLDPTECGDAGGRDICRFSLVAGDAVVFTGEAPGIERLELEYQAKSLGLRVTSAVSGKTRLVVAADPDSISGKARKARDLGIPIVDYASYLTMLDSLSC